MRGSLSGALRLLAYVILPAVIGLTIWYRHGQAGPPLPTIKPLPDFELIERSGRTIRLSDLKGKIWIADFMYTTCPGPCPMMTSNLSGMQSALLKNDDVRFVSISTNPEVDTPEVLRGYAEKFHASPDKWLFLTGDKARIYELGNKGFLLSVAEAKEGKEPIVHSTKLVLIDKNGTIRGYYDPEPDESREKLVRDVERLQRE